MSLETPTSAKRARQKIAAVEVLMQRDQILGQTFAEIRSTVQIPLETFYNQYITTYTSKALQPISATMLRISAAIAAFLKTAANVRDVQDQSLIN